MTPEEIRAEFEEATKAWTAKLEEEAQARQVLQDKLDTQATEFDGIRTSLEEMGTKLQASEERADALEASMTRSVQNAQETPKSFGQKVVDSEVFKRQVETSSFGGLPIEVDSGFVNRRSLTTASVSGGTLAQPMRVPGVVSIPDRFPRLRDLMNVIPLADTGNVEFVRTVDFFNFVATSDVAALTAQPAIHYSNVNGFFVGQSVTVETDGADEVKEVLTVVADTTTTEDGGIVTYTTNLASAVAIGKESHSDVFAGTAEGNLKPEQNPTLSVESATVVTIAHSLPASNQILADTPRLQSFLDTEMIEGLGDVEDFQILYGAGTSVEINGITADASVQSYAWSAGVSGDTKYDAIRRAMTLGWLARYRPTATVLHPTDWESIETAKGSDGHYLRIRLEDAQGNPIAWNVPVVVTDQIDVGQGLTGAWQRATRLYEREGANVRIFDQHKDFAGRNMVLIRAEKRIAQTVERPEAFVVINFDAAP